MHVIQPKIGASEAVDKFLVIDPQAMEYCRLEIVDVHRLLRGDNEYLSTP